MLRNLLVPLNRQGLRYMSSPTMSHALKKRLDEMVQNDKVVLFMKGTPDEPMCGFSNASTKILQIHQVPFKSYDVLSDQEIREGVKEYSEWPTIPQLYVGGEFVGGCDIMVQLHQSGEILDVFRKAGVPSKFDKEEKK